MQNSRLLFPFIFFFLLISCEEKYTPKPHAFERIAFPKKEFIKYQNPCHYEMLVPVYTEIIREPYPTAGPCWYNVKFLPFNATLHLSYEPVNGRKDLYKLIEDSRTLVYKHVIRADEIIENSLGNERLHDIFYELTGNTATNAQFYVTDSTRHFLRGSLYFDQKTDIDSIAPVLEFIKKDIMTMLNTLEWK